MKRVQLQLNPTLVEYLAVLGRSGFYGLSEAEICERLICRQIEALTMGERSPISDQLCRVAKTAITS